MQPTVIKYYNAKATHMLIDYVCIYIASTY